MNQTRRAPRALLALSVALTASACDRGLTDLNVNPNEPVAVGAEYLFTNAVEASVSRTMGAFVNLDLTGLWAQHYAETRYSTEDRYVFVASTIQSQWTGYWAGPMQDFNEVVTKGREAGRPNVEAMGIIMRSWNYGIITDLWGDIGYTGALQGRLPGSGNAVEYDTQEQVYKGLLTELRTASGMLDPAGLSMGNADLLYQGDAEQWARFANSLRLRLAMRMSQADATTARDEFTAALADGVFTSNDDNALVRYVDNGVDVNPIHAYHRSAPTHAVSATLVDTLLQLDDPRLALYANANGDGEYRGMPNGTTDEPPLNQISHIGDFFARANAPAYVMTYAEVLFLRAEAAERGWIAGDPATLYRQAITAHMQMLGIEQDEIDAYLAQGRVAYGGLPSIALQKWIALYGNGPEAYAEWRRTGYPVLQPGPDAENEGLTPLRLEYPASELSLNRTAYEAARARQGGATVNSPVWWDR